MKHNRILSAYTLVILSAFLFISILGSNVAKADSTLGKKMVESYLIVGTYLLTEANEGGSRIITITADGSWYGVHSLQFDENFSNQQGLWKKIERRTITARTLNFALLEDGVGSSLFSFTIEFDKSYSQITGELSGKTFPPDVDPLDPDALPINTFSNTFTGKRLIVTDD